MILMQIKFTLQIYCMYVCHIKFNPNVFCHSGDNTGMWTDRQTDHCVILFYAHYDRTELQTMLLS